jgi:hypothetical protein
MNSERLSFLLSAYVDGVLTPDEKLELEQALLSSAICRAQFWKQTRLHEQLRTISSETKEDAGGKWISPALIKQHTSEGTRRNRDFWRRPLTAAVAGIVLSALCTSAVWAYAGQWLAPKSKVVCLSTTDFESISSVPPTGIPSSSGQWSGDYSRLVGAENGVQPHSGHRMLRFLRADNALSSSETPNYVGEAAYIVDLRPHRAELQQGSSQIEITAWFAASDYNSTHNPFRFLLKAATFNGSPSEAPLLWEDTAHASLSMVQQQTPHAASPGQWQSLTISVPIPPTADLIVFECGVLQCAPRPKSGTVEFPGHYVDDVSVLLRTPSGPLPLQSHSKETP